MHTQKLFKQLTAKESGITFKNTIQENDTLNYFTFPYMYMGGGVAVGDINNDGLQDIYFTSNQGKNKLYLNLGNLKFKDITKTAGVGGTNQWYTGATMIDINNDGLLDIYVCASGKSGDRKNKLYINKGNNTFVDEAAKYGIADDGHSTQASFFDYDDDGDLDLYIANYPPAKTSSTIAFYKYKMDHPTLDESDKLYRNNGNNTFTDVTKESGILNYGLSLSANIGDFNDDGWPDIYVSNDFSSPDYFYINNKNGTFTNKVNSYLKHTSLYGMGVDIADINNDNKLDFMQLDMTAADNRRLKSNMSGMNEKGFWETVDDSMQYQYMKNSLQLNRGSDKNGNLFFSDISRLAGVATTDWSWSVLFADLDNDGWKDIFVTNGSRRDVNNTDFFRQLKKKSLFQPKLTINEIKKIPSEKLPNYAFKNNGNLTFTNDSKKWGLDFKGFSNGAAYADLDNDGDLDIIINNLDSKSLIFKNLSVENSKNHFLNFKLKGPKNNVLGLGTKITISDKGATQFQEYYLTRGFQSSVGENIHFGVGNKKTIEKVKIVWPNGNTQLLTNVKTNKTYKVNYKNAIKPIKKLNSHTHTLFTDITNLSGVSYKHKENKYNDYKLQSLLPYKTSTLGPKLAVGDINNDGLEDFFIGDAAGSAGAIYIQNANNTFSLLPSKALQKDKAYEDMGAAFVDVNGDGYKDLYVVSGGNSVPPNSPLLQDRIYLNDGKGHFTRKENILPKMFTSGSCVKPMDFDGDGDMDLFVGGRLVPGNYPLPAKSYLLENVGGKFIDATKKLAPALVKPGLITDAVWTDYNSDGKIDLITVGEWMPISVFKNVNGKFVLQSKNNGLENTSGWWSSITQGDFDGDGDMDYVVGNLGLNYKYKASDTKPFEVYADDFDKNGTMDIVLSYYNGGVSYPVRGRSCSSRQTPAVAKKFKTYNSFSVANVDQVYGKNALKKATHYAAKTFASSYIENLGNGKFKVTKLPNIAQISSINKIITKDFNKDGVLDILIGGNLYGSEIETTRNDSSIGLFLAGNGHGQFTPYSRQKSGFYVTKNVKDMRLLKTSNGFVILVANNNDNMQVIKVNN